MGSFESWATVIGGILKVAGIFRPFGFLKAHVVDRCWLRASNGLSAKRKLGLPGSDQCQSGFLSLALWFVRLVWLEPSAFITYISLFPFLLDQKTILVPLGDQRGSASSALLLVRRVCTVPSEFMTYTSALPSLKEVKATLLPSGDQEGAFSAAVLLVRRV